MPKFKYDQHKGRMVMERDDDRTPDPRLTGRKPTPQERTRAQVYATGNKWAIENYEATHN
jgi:hypothetical protein